MSNCVNCGNWVPDEQISCSMCYGDPCHGNDNYYQDYLDRLSQEQEEQERENEN